MKITPLEIRQKSFEKNFRGYDKEEVSAFLLSMSHEWERLQDEKNRLDEKLKNAEQEVKKLREVESTLYKTLKTAEDTGAQVVEQANRQAELSMKESKMSANQIISGAREKARHMQVEAEEFAKNIVNEMQEELRSMEQGFRQIAQQRDSLLNDLRNLASATQDKVAKFADNSRDHDFREVIKEAKQSFIKKMDSLRDDFAHTQEEILHEEQASPKQPGRENKVHSEETKVRPEPRKTEPRPSAPNGPSRTKPDYANTSQEKIRRDAPADQPSAPMAASERRPEVPTPSVKKEEQGASKGGGSFFDSI